MLDSDHLLQYLLDEIALCGNRSASFEDVKGFTKAYYQLGIGIQQNQISATSQTRSALVPDDLLIGQVWKWLLKHRNVLVTCGKCGYSKEKDASAGKGRSRLPRSECDTCQKVAHELRNGQLRKKVAIEDLKVRVSENQLWQTICGHAIDSNKLSPQEFACLLVIAQQRERGIHQKELVTITGQDIRSVPPRTQKLHEAGYIHKVPVVFNAARTSWLVLSKFPRSKDQATQETSTISAVAETEEEQNPNTDTGSKSHEDLELQLQKLIDTLAKYKLIVWDDLKREVGVFRNAKSSKSLAESVRFLEQLSIAKRVRAYGVKTSAKTTPYRCVKFLRRPRSDEWSLLLKRHRGNSLSSHAVKPEDAFPELPEDENDLEEFSASGEINTSIAGDRPCNYSPKLSAETNVQAALYWDPNRLLQYVLVDLLEDQSCPGLSLMDIRKHLGGNFFHRPVENCVGRLVEYWQFSQPPHLGYLGLVRDVSQSKKMKIYIHYTRKQYQDRVDRGDASWSSVQLCAEDYPLPASTDLLGFLTLVPTKDSSYSLSSAPMSAGERYPSIGRWTPARKLIEENAFYRKKLTSGRAEDFVRATTTINLQGPTLTPSATGNFGLHPGSQEYRERTHRGMTAQDCLEPGTATNQAANDSFGLSHTTQSRESQDFTHTGDKHRSPLHSKLYEGATNDNGELGPPTKVSTGSAGRGRPRKVRPYFPSIAAHSSPSHTIKARKRLPPGVRGNKQHWVTSMPLFEASKSYRIRLEGANPIGRPRLSQSTTAKINGFTENNEQRTDTQRASPSEQITDYTQRDPLALEHQKRISIHIDNSRSSRRLANIPASGLSEAPGNNPNEDPDKTSHIKESETGVYIDRSSSLLVPGRRGRPRKGFFIIIRHPKLRELLSRLSGDIPRDVQASSEVQPDSHIDNLTSSRQQLLVEHDDIATPHKSASNPQRQEPLQPQIFEDREGQPAHNLSSRLASTRTSMATSASSSKPDTKTQEPGISPVTPNRKPSGRLTVESHRSPESTNSGVMIITKPRSSGGTIGVQRRELLMNLVKRNGGVFLKEDIWLPFATIWMKSYPDWQTDKQTVQKEVKYLIQQGTLQQHTFNLRSKAGEIFNRSILHLPRVGIDDPKLRSLEDKIKESFGRTYIPEGFEVSTKLLKRQPGASVASGQGYVNQLGIDAGLVERLPKFGHSGRQMFNTTSEKENLGAGSAQPSSGDVQDAQFHESILANGNSSTFSPHENQRPPSRTLRAPKEASASFRSKSRGSNTFQADIRSYMSNQMSSREHSEISKTAPDPHTAKSLVDGTKSKDAISLGASKFLDSLLRPGFERTLRLPTAGNDTRSAQDEFNETVNLVAEWENSESAEPFLNRRDTRFLNHEFCGEHNTSDNALWRQPEGRYKFKISLDEQEGFVLSSKQKLVSAQQVSENATQPRKKRKTSKTGQRKALKKTFQTPKNGSIPKKTSLLGGKKKLKRYTMDAYERRTADWTFFVAFVVVSALSAKEIKPVKCDVMSLALSKRLNLSESEVKTGWNPVHDRYAHMFDDVLDRFHHIYTIGVSMKHVPCPKDIQPSQWPDILDWTMLRIGSPAAFIHLLKSREEFDKLYKLVPLSNRDIDKYNEASGPSSVQKRDYILHKHPFPFPSMAKSQKSISEKVKIAKSWIKAELFTPEESVNDGQIEQKLSLLSEDVIESAREELLAENFVTRGNAERSLLAKDCSLSAYWKDKLKVTEQETQLLDAFKFKLELDECFSAGNEFFVELDASDGAHMAMTYLAWWGCRVEQEPEEPSSDVLLPTTEDEDDEQIPRVILRQKENYIFGDPVPARPHPPQGPEQTVIEGLELVRYPLWVDLNGNLIPQLWKAALCLVLIALDTGPYQTAAFRSSVFGHGWEAADIALIYQWIVAAGLAEWMDEKKNSIKAGEWWWMAVKPESED